MSASKVNSIVERILHERERQRSLPGSELDLKNSVNDWIAIAGGYLTEPANRKWANSHWGSASQAQEFEDSLVKAAAVIIAALEHSEMLQAKGDLV